MTSDQMNQQKKQFGLLVKAARRHGGFGSYADLAASVNCSIEDIKSIEVGNATCDYATILRVCSVLGIPSDAAEIYDPDIIY